MGLDKAAFLHASDIMPHTECVAGDEQKQFTVRDISELVRQGHREMGGSPLIIGIIIATEAFSQFCAAPLIGHLSDRVGRKRILI
ncbi:hypothetical protein MJN51_35800, partial [Salmonella enterica subsp. enterica serovar Kentucky]|nr:hypothetical protein [Salmonella enterica subsp. enterica serovar Kentucky]